MTPATQNAAGFVVEAGGAPAPLTALELKASVDFAGARRLVQTAIEQAVLAPSPLLRFFARYTAWNAQFGSGVASLAGKIGRNRGLFADPAEPIALLADRSVFVASYFFDAARDEFDDRDTAHRDTHRCLAQALLKGLLAWQATHGHTVFADPTAMNEFFREPEWLRGLSVRVAQGYGVGSAEEAPAIFHAIGYHLGSEVLADAEFSLLDATLRQAQPELVAALQTMDVDIAGQPHSAYTWLRLHSGHGNAVEADHFAWAEQGLALATRYSPPTLHPELRAQVLAGFAAFARDHHGFFSLVLED